MTQAAAHMPVSSADGWRGIIGQSFTRQGARRLVAAILDVHEREIWKGPARILVAHDARAMGAQVAADAAALAGTRVFGHQVTLVAHLPTSTASYLTANGYDLALLVTASHNPPNWNGIKLKVAPGLSAPPKLVAAIDAQLARAVPPDGKQTVLPKKACAEDLVSKHVEAVAECVPLQYRRPFRVSVDGLGGISEPAICALGDALGWQVRPSERAVKADFGGAFPDPSKPEALKTLQRRVLSECADFGLGFDGDGDRMYVVDDAGEIVAPHDLMAWLILKRNAEGVPLNSVAVTQSTGMSVRLAARKSGALVIETPIGFKYIASLLEAREVDAGVGAVGDLAFRDLCIDRDPLHIAGQFSHFLAKAGRPFSQELASMRSDLGVTGLRWIEDHFRDTGPVDVQAGRAALRDAAQSTGLQVKSVETLSHGSLRIRCNQNQWLMLRPSTTEGGLRLYGELLARDGDHAQMRAALVDKVTQAVRSFQFINDGRNP